MYSKKLPEPERDEKIDYLEQYEIPCMNDDDDGQARFGIGVANFFGLFTGDEFDYPDHWFLIARTKKGKFYLIEKGEGGKNFSLFESKANAKDSVRGCYNNNDVSLTETYHPENLTLGELFDYAKSLPEYYNLIDNNCQDFVRAIINRFC